MSAAVAVIAATLIASTPGAVLAAEPTAIVESTRIVSGTTVNLNPEVAGDHRHLKVQVQIAGTAEPTPEVQVSMAQYGSRGGATVANPRISLEPLTLTLARTNGDLATYNATVSFADLQVAGARIRPGRSALLCIDTVTARSAGVDLPQSSAAQSAQGGTECITVVHRRGSTTPKNQLFTGILRDASMTKATGAARYLTFTTEQLAYFSDRPDRTAENIPFAVLAASSTWVDTFGQKAPVVEIAIDGTTRHVPVRMGVPEALGDDRYRAKIRFPTSSRLTAAAVSGKDLAFFASATPVNPPDPDTCRAQSEALAEGYVPGGSDFVGSLSSATVEAIPGEAHLLLRSSDPLFFTWYRGSGYGCDSQRTGSTDFAALANPSEWGALFGRINPNSALLWEDGSRTRVLEFEQDRPEYDQTTGTWTSVIRPFFGNSMPSQKSVDRFVKKFGSTLKVTSPYLFMDATGSVAVGGGLWNVDENFQIMYHVLDGETITFTFTLTNGFDGWMGLCFHEFMFPADCIITWMEGNQPFGWDSYNPGIPALPAFPAPLQDTDPILVLPDGSPYDNKDNLTNIMGTRMSETVSVSVQRALITEDIFDFQIYPDRLFNVIAAYSKDQIFLDEDGSPQPEHTAYGAARWELTLS